MNKKAIISIISVLFMIFIFPNIFITIMDRLSFNSQLQRDIKTIKSEFKGIVISKKSYRKNIPPTHINVKTYSGTIEISPYNIEQIEIGDSIIKPKNENIFIVKKVDSNFQRYFVRLSSKERNSSKFPEEWKYKWTESSAWDTIRKN